MSGITIFQSLESLVQEKNRLRLYRYDDHVTQSPAVTPDPDLEPSRTDDGSDVSLKGRQTGERIHVFDSSMSKVYKPLWCDPAEKVRLSKRLELNQVHYQTIVCAGKTSYHLYRNTEHCNLYNTKYINSQNNECFGLWQSPDKGREILMKIWELFSIMIWLCK